MRPFWAELDRLWARGTAVLGCKCAIMGGAMTWVSERNLVAAISNAGGFGVIASGSMSPELLSAEIAATRSLTERPFGVNLITLHPRLIELIDICAAHRVGHVVLAGGLPSGAAMSRIKQIGARVFCFAPALGFARKLVRMGADAIIIEGSEAGGHVGPVSTGVLAQEICRISTMFRFSLPEVLDVAKPCWPISKWARLVCSSARALSVPRNRSPIRVQASIHPRRGARRRHVASARSSFPGDPGPGARKPWNRAVSRREREIIDQFTRGELSQKAAQLEIEHFWAGALRRAVIDGDVEAGSLMAGQSVGFVTREQSSAEILEELINQALAVLAARSERVGHPAPFSGRLYPSGGTHRNE